MTLYALAITLVVALLCGGKLRDLERVEIRHLWIFPTALVLMLLIEYCAYRQWLPAPLAFLAQPGVYLVTVIGLVLNRHIRGTLLLALGTFLNFLVIAANGGYMPVSAEAVSAAGLKMDDLASLNLRHTVMTEQTRLPWLADIIPVPWPHAFRNVGSVGDLIVMAAMVYVVWRLFFPAHPARPRVARRAL